MNIRSYTIESAGLDTIRVIVIPHTTGKSRVIIQCYTKAWTAYWGGHGDRTVESFMAMNNKHYIAENMFQGASDGMTSRVEIENQRKYVERIAQAVISYFKEEK